MAIALVQLSGQLGRLILVLILKFMLRYLFVRDVIESFSFLYD